MDFDARVPIPISIFPSTYKGEQETTVQTDTEVDVKSGRRDGRQQYDSRVQVSETSGGPRKGTRKESIYVEEDIYGGRRGGKHTNVTKEDIRIRADDRNYRENVDIDVDFERRRYRDHPHRRHHDTEFVEKQYYDEDIQVDTAIDIAERDYRRRTVPFVDERIDEIYRSRGPYTEVEEKVIVDDKMGYYDEDGHYHSFRQGMHRAADRVTRPFHGERVYDRVSTRVDVAGGDEVVREEVDVDINTPAQPRLQPVRHYERRRHHNTVTIPCHHIRIGDLLILQGRPCQVIRITTSTQTGQYRYLGVDLFTKQLQEESSFISNPSPSVVVQNMLGPVFKEYRVLDIREDGRVVAMTETGDVKQALPVLNQSNLWVRLNDSFANGRGSVRVLVINDGGRELAVDYKTVHGSRL